MRHSFLVIDDSKLHHQMYRLIFSRGALSRAAPSTSPPTGGRATVCSQGHPELALVLLDLNMPEMNGLELLERRRAEGLHPHIPIVLVTTEGTAEDEARGRAAGAWDYLRKPFQPADVERLVARVIERGAPAA